jgi:pyrroline-5-carboxylate reductase
MKIAVLGCGNMASPIIERIYQADSKLCFYTYTPSSTKAIRLAQKVNGVHVKELCDFPVDIDYVLVACKPQQFSNLIEGIPDSLKKAKFISIMAGIPLEKIQKEIKHDCVIRVMPNTPVKLGEGISLVYSNSDKYSKETKQVSKWFSYCGIIHEVTSEREFDQLTTITGSAPAYIFSFAKSYFLKLKELNQTDEHARKMVEQMFLGSSMLMKSDAQELSELITQVTSKGGVTQAALKVFTSNGTNQLDRLVSLSIDQAILRSEELSQL